MFIASCPECGDSLTFPAGVSLSSRCRCPLCTESFTLEDCLTELPPMVELLDGDFGAGMSPGYAGGTAVAAAPRAAAGFAGTSTAAPRSQVGAKPIAAGRTPARRAKGGNPIIQMAQVVVGGAVGVALAVLIIWWAIGKDPFNLAPTVAQYAPFMVPAKFRPLATPAPGTDDVQGGAKKVGTSDDAAPQDPPQRTGRNQGQPLEGPRFDLEPGKLPSLDPIGGTNPPGDLETGGAFGPIEVPAPDDLFPPDAAGELDPPMEIEAEPSDPAAFELDPLEPSAELDPLTPLEPSTELDPSASFEPSLDPIGATDPEMIEGEATAESPLGDLPPQEPTDPPSADFPSLPTIDLGGAEVAPTEATPGDPFSLVMTSGPAELPEVAEFEGAAWTAFAQASPDDRKKLAAAHYDALAGLAQVVAGLPASAANQAAVSELTATLADRFATPVNQRVANLLGNQRLKNPDMGLAGVIVVGRVEESRQDGSLNLVTITQEEGASPETKRLVIALREGAPPPEPGTLVAALGVKYAGTDETLPPSLAQETAPIILAGAVAPVGGTTPPESAPPTDPATTTPDAPASEEPASETPAPSEPAAEEPATEAPAAPTEEEPAAETPSF